LVEKLTALKVDRVASVATMYTRGTILLEICTPDIRLYQGYQPDIRGIINGYHEKIGQISIKYLMDFGGKLKNISWICLNISQILVGSGHRIKRVKNC